MDSKNLAICWWPTLFRYDFGDLGKFEAMRPHFEDIFQAMVDQYLSLFGSQEDASLKAKVSFFQIFQSKHLKP